MLCSKIVAVCFVTATLMVAKANASHEGNARSSNSNYDDDGGSSLLPAYVYTFDPKYSGGVSGTIRVQYAGALSTFAIIRSSLDFNDVNQSEIMVFDSNCTNEVSEYKWHIHVKWPHDRDSESFEQCGLAITGNHYDPLKACGPNSEFARTEECLHKTPGYSCNPNTYAANPLVCEKGDLSGKFGGIKLDDSKQVSKLDYDFNYPLPEENTPEWNMILHAVCGQATPRIACAVGKLSAQSGAPSQTTSNSPPL